MTKNLCFIKSLRLARVVLAQYRIRSRRRKTFM